MFPKQTGCNVKEENGEVKNEVASDTDYFGDIETSSSDSLEQSRSNSEDGISETYFKGKQISFYTYVVGRSIFGHLFAEVVQILEEQKKEKSHFKVVVVVVMKRILKKTRHLCSRRAYSNCCFD